MIPAAYVAKRLERLASEIRVELERPTVRNHPDAALLASTLGRAVGDLEAVATLLDHAPETVETPAATVSEGVSAPVRFGFIATGRDGFAGPEIYAQDAAGTVWARGDEGIASAHRFASREEATPIAGSRGGYPYPVPVA